MPKVTVAAVADHIEYIRKVAGVDYIGIGSDFDGNTNWPEGLSDVSMFPNLLRRARPPRLERRGPDEGRGRQRAARAGAGRGRGARLQARRPRLSLSPRPRVVAPRLRGVAADRHVAPAAAARFRPVDEGPGAVRARADAQPLLRRRQHVLDLRQATIAAIRSRSSSSAATSERKPALRRIETPAPSRPRASARGGGRAPRPAGCGRPRAPRRSRTAPRAASWRARAPWLRAAGSACARRARARRRLPGSRFACAAHSSRRS